MATDQNITVPEEKPCPPVPKHRTVGNKIYDGAVYTTFAWGGVALASAVSAYAAQHGKSWWRAFNDACVNSLEKVIKKIPAMPERNIKHYAKGTTMFLTLGLGGWLMMAPIKWLEDNREKNAARIDRLLGTREPDPRVVEAEIPQTWHSVLSGRMVSWGLSYAAFLAMPPKVAQAANEFFSKATAKAWMKIRPSSNAVNVKKWTDIAAFDALFTVITATVTYAYSRYVARQDYELEHPEILQPSGTSTAPTAIIPTEAGDKSFAAQHSPAKRPLSAPSKLHTLKIEQDPISPALS